MTEPVVITIFYPRHCSHCVTRGNFLVYGTVSSEEVATATDGLEAYAQVVGEPRTPGIRVLTEQEKVSKKIEGSRFDWAFLFKGVIITKGIRVVVQKTGDPSTRAIAHIWATGKPLSHDTTITIGYPSPPVNTSYAHVAGTFTTYGMIDPKPSDLSGTTMTASLSPGSIPGTWKSSPPDHLEWAFDFADVTAGTYTLSVRYSGTQGSALEQVTLTTP